ncbi:MAG: sugar-binding protein, partial [Gemmatimonadota bacterium]
EIVTYQITRADAPPHLDGVLDDACWPRALVIDDFGVLGRGDSAAPVPATQAWLTYDADDLYVAFRCAEPLADRMILRAAEHDDRTWSDDEVEVFFDAAGERQGYVQLAVNARGVIMDAFFGSANTPLDASYETGADAQARIGQAEWTLELRIPFAGLPLAGPDQVWTFSLARNRAAAGQLLCSLHSGVSGFHEIAKFDRLEGIALPERTIGLASYSLGDLYRGTNLCRAVLRNWGTAAQEVTVGAGVEGAAASRRGERRVRVPADQEVGVEVPWDLAAGDNGRRVSLEVRGRERLHQARSTIVRQVPDLFGPPVSRAFYLDTASPAELALPVRLAEGSRRDVRLSWEAVNEAGARMGQGQVGVVDSVGRVPLRWKGQQPGRYAVRLELRQGGRSLGTAEERVRLVECPWGGQP